MDKVFSPIVLCADRRIHLTVAELMERSGRTMRGTDTGHAHMREGPTARSRDIYPIVSVVILNYNGKKYLGDILDNCIKSVLDSDYPKIEVIFVDNGSTDGSVKYLKDKFKDNKDIKYVSLDKNYGIAKGYNEGVLNSTGSVVLFLNNDIHVTKEAIRKMTDILLYTDDIGVVGCRILNADGSIQSEGEEFPRGEFLYLLSPSLARAQYDYKYFQKKSSSNVTRDVDWILGGALMIKKSILYETGMFNEYFWAFYEEIDLCYRVKKANYRVVCIDDTFIIHYGKLTSPSNKWRIDLNARNKLLFYVKNYPFPVILFNILVHLAWVIKLLTYRTRTRELRDRARADVKGLTYVFKKAEIPK